MKCPYCGRENDEQVKICIRCKAAIPHEGKKDRETNMVMNKRNKKERE